MSVKRATRGALASALTLALLGIGALGIGAPAATALPAPAAPAARAADPATFDPGYIISDSKFFDIYSMDEGEIQDFLDAKMSLCYAREGVPCLKDYTESTVSLPATTRCGAYTGAIAEPASRIIHKVAVACGISPQVLLVTLQKENSLVTSGRPSAGAYKTAMGYGCPDSSVCVTEYYGFFNQLYRASSQFIRYGVTPANWNFHIGTVAVKFHPNPECGTTEVTIRNQATANLYNYTPYQPNAAAMAELVGSGVRDACSSFGNRNFWNYFTKWFGPAT